MKVFFKCGEEKWLLIHIEVQGDRDPDFSIRMFRYYYRIFDFHHEDVVAIAILTDDSKAFRPNQYKRSSYGTKLLYEFNMAKLVDYNEEELLQSATRSLSLYSLLNMQTKPKKMIKNAIASNGNYSDSCYKEIMDPKVNGAYMYQHSFTSLIIY